jgi:hypothetical protein
MSGGKEEKTNVEEVNKAPSKKSQEEMIPNSQNPNWKKNQGS